MQTKAPRRHFQTIEGMRAAGAFLIVMRHVPMFFGGVRVPESFLAVDLFYLVSGFVIAHAYARRLEQGGYLREFFLVRLIRLYPLYLVGILIGVIPATIATVGDPNGWWNPTRLGEAIATGIFMIPLFPGLSANGSSLDGPVWTLAPELIANMAYAAAIRFMTVPVLLAIMLVSAAGVAFAAVSNGNLDVGYNNNDQWAALARVGFSFFAGVLLYRWAPAVERRSTLLAWVCAGLVALALALRPPAALTVAYELGLVLVGFPLLVAVATRYEPAAGSGRLFSFIGLMSYGVYIVHQPLGVLARLASGVLHWQPSGPAAWLTGPAFLGFLVGLAWFLDRFYDGPARKWLRARLMPARAASQAS
jgi:peptidoglycan/LPS O-acetylase OafA/YrhL